MKNFLFLCAALLWGTASQSQHIPCLYDLATEQMEREYPGYKQHVQRVIGMALSEERAKRTEEIYTVPVVVHIVWKEPGENIPQARIEAQIEVLNEIFRRQNADTVNTRSLFHPVVGDPQIEFVLTEVIRVQTNEFFQPTFTLSGTTLPDKVKRSAQGGSDAVDPTHHLNIWVCAIRPLNILGTQSPILGYAYPPAGLAHWPAGAAAPSPNLEGVVVDYRAVGDSLVYQAYGLGPLPIRGRAMAHEVGHYLGLRHISGDGLLASLGLPDCDADDGVADTPPQGLQSQFICNPQQNTCNDGAEDLPDMIENYMDYSLETCQNSFTQGQIEIMRAVLEGPRAGLISPISNTRYASASDSPISLFPNPASQLLQLRFTSPSVAQTQVRILDIQGRLMWQAYYELPPPILSIPLYEWPAGMYVLHLSEEGGKTYVKQWVRQ